MVAPKKIKLGERLQHYIKEYPTVLVVEVNNVGSRQFAEIRFALRGKAHVFKGKNTMTRCLIKQLIDADPKNEHYQHLYSLVGANMAFIFCIASLSEVRRIVLDNKVPAIAKAGTISQCNVDIPAGPTPLEPSNTAFFGALGIATKIVKGKIEIISPIYLLKEGVKVGKSEATLLQKLDIKPFAYGFVATQVCDHGSVYPAKILEITDDILVQKMLNGIKNVAAISRQVGFPTSASVPHALVEAFKNCAALCLKGDFEFEEIAKMRELCA